MFGQSLLLIVLLRPGLAGAVPASQQQVILGSTDSKLLRENGYEVRHQLRKAEIIPTVIDDFLPSMNITAEWPSEKESSLGNTLNPKKLQDEPSITLENPTSSMVCRSGVTYTITMTDPDAPSRDNPKWAEMCHWIATSLAVSSPPSPDSDSESCSKLHLTSLKDIMPYKAPGPPPKTGKHRYVLLVFAPANGTTDSLNLTKPKDRQHWGTGKERHGVRDWAAENGLIPVAANFFYAQNKKQ